LVFLIGLREREGVAEPRESACCWLCTFPRPRRGCGNVGIAERFPRTVISTALCGLRLVESRSGLNAGSVRAGQGEHWRFFPDGRLQSESSDEEAPHCETGTVLSVHLLLHENSRIRARRIRHAEAFQGIAAIGAPDGSHIGSQWFHRASTGARSVDSSADSSGGTARFGIGISSCTAACGVAFELPAFGSQHTQ